MSNKKVKKRNPFCDYGSESEEEAPLPLPLPAAPLPASDLPDMTKFNAYSLDLRELAKFKVVDATLPLSSLAAPKRERQDSEDGEANSQLDELLRVYHEMEAENPTCRSAGPGECDCAFFKKEERQWDDLRTVGDDEAAANDCECSECLNEAIREYKEYEQISKMGNVSEAEARALINQTRKLNLISIAKKEPNGLPRKVKERMGYLHEMSLGRPVGFYEHPPNLDIVDPKIIETAAKKRMQLYTIILYAERIAKPFTKMWLTHVKRVIMAKVREFGPLFEDERNFSSDEVKKAREFDIFSHFICRYFYKSSAEELAEFKKFETLWFLIRLKFIKHHEVLTYLVKLNMVTREEKLELFEIGVMDHDDLKEIFFKVPFFEMPLTLRERKTILHDGVQYFKSNQIIYLLQTKFSEKMKKYLNNLLKNNGNHFFMDLGLRNVVKVTTPSITFTHQKEKQIYEKVNLINIHSNVDKFPPCMQHIYNHVVQTHHVKHYGRLQLSTFLYHANFPLDTSLAFWKEEFLKHPKMSEQDYIREKHDYKIKHVYGVVGRQEGRRPDTCKDIEDLFIGPMDCHGCPFSFMEKDDLDNHYLKGVTPAVKKEIFEAIDRTQYTRACGILLEEKTQSKKQLLISHPNQVFEINLNNL